MVKRMSHFSLACKYKAHKSLTLTRLSIRVYNRDAERHSVDLPPTLLYQHPNTTSPCLSVPVSEAMGCAIITLNLHLHTLCRTQISYYSTVFHVEWHRMDQPWGGRCSPQGLTSSKCCVSPVPHLSAWGTHGAPKAPHKTVPFHTPPMTTRSVRHNATAGAALHTPTAPPHTPTPEHLQNMTNALSMCHSNVGDGAWDSVPSPIPIRFDLHHITNLFHSSTLLPCCSMKR